MSPRNVRNFFIKVKVDGKQKTVATGPRGKDGGLYIRLYQRDNGEVTNPISIWCHVNQKGELITEVDYPRLGYPEQKVILHATQR